LPRLRIGPQIRVGSAVQRLSQARIAQIAHDGCSSTSR
jgi:hypothetical protein